VIIWICYVIILWFGPLYLSVIVSQGFIWKMRIDADQISYIRHQDGEYQHQNQENNSGLWYFHHYDNILRDRALLDWVKSGCLRLSWSQCTAALLIHTYLHMEVHVRIRHLFRTNEHERRTIERSKSLMVSLAFTVTTNEKCNTTRDLDPRL